MERTDCPDILLVHDTALSGRNLLEALQDGGSELIDRVLRQLQQDVLT